MIRKSRSKFLYAVAAKYILIGASCRAKVKLIDETVIVEAFAELHRNRRAAFAFDFYPYPAREIRAHIGHENAVALVFP